MSTIDELKARKSVRVFEERTISEEIKEQLYTAAFEAPTAGNQMLYSIIEITDPQLLAQLAQRPVCGTYFDAVREMLQSDMPLQIAWNKTFSRIPDAETAEVLRRMELGGDETRLLTQLEDARQVLTTLAARWAREDAQDRRVAGALALSAAGLLVILLI